MKVIQRSLQDRGDPAKTLGITLHLSSDRLKVLTTSCSLLLEWASRYVNMLIPGRGIAFYVSVLVTTHTRRRVHSALKALQKTFSSTKSCFLSFCLVRSNATIDKYPINFMRNCALKLSCTELVALLDVDFVISRSLVEAWLSSDSVESVLKDFCITSKGVLVLPAFEESMRVEENMQNSPRGGTNGQEEDITTNLSGCLSDIHSFKTALECKTNVISSWEKGHVEPFASSIFPEGHRATNFSQWKGSSLAYNVEYEEGFEPFVIAARVYLPRYDERFEGYGRNKVIYFYHLFRLGFCFRVHSEWFTLHRAHAPSPAALATLGAPRSPGLPGPGPGTGPGGRRRGGEGREPGRLEGVKRLYRQVKAEIDEDLSCNYGTAANTRPRRKLLDGVNGKYVAEPFGFWRKDDYRATLIENSLVLTNLYSLKFCYTPRVVHVVDVFDFDKESVFFEENQQYITLTTQCSFDRISRLEELCARWDGPISAAVLLSPRQRAMGAGTKALRRMARQFPHLKLLVCIKDRGPSLDSLYPMNAMRNVALDAAETEHVFLVDVDLMPSHGMHEKLSTIFFPRCAGNEDTKEEVQFKDPSYLFSVIPAFEVLKIEEHLEISSALLGPSVTLKAAEKMYTEKKIRGFHVGHYKEGHGPTNYDKFFTAGEPYQIDYAEGMEPYGVFSKSNAPKFDERFRGFGFDKVSFVWELDQRGWSFEVLPSVYLLDRPHEPSPAAAAGRQCPRRRAAAAGLWARFRRQAAAALAREEEEEEAAAGGEGQGGGALRRRRRRRRRQGGRAAASPAGQKEGMKVEPANLVLADMWPVIWGLPSCTGAQDNENITTGQGWKLRGDHGLAENLEQIDIGLLLKSRPLGTAGSLGSHQRVLSAQSRITGHHELRGLRAWLRAGGTVPSITPDGQGGVCVSSVVPAAGQALLRMALRYWVYFPPAFEWCKGGRLPGLQFIAEGSDFQIIWTDVGTLRFRAPPEYEVVWEAARLALERGRWHLVQWAADASSSADTHASEGGAASVDAAAVAGRRRRRACAAWLDGRPVLQAREREPPASRPSTPLAAFQTQGGGGSGGGGSGSGPPGRGPKRDRFRLNLFAFYFGDEGEGPSRDFSLDFCGFEVWINNTTSCLPLCLETEQNDEQQTSSVAATNRTKPAQGTEFPYGKSKESWMQNGLFNLLPNAPIPNPEKTSNCRFIFCLSVGRSGTQFLARLLATAKENVLSFHEAVPDLSGEGLRAIEDDPDGAGASVVTDKLRCIWDQVGAYGGPAMRRRRGGLVYADTSHLFAATFGGAAMRALAPRHRIDIIVLRRPLEEVVCSRANLGHFSRLASHPWFSSLALRTQQPTLDIAIKQQGLSPLTLLGLNVLAAERETRHFQSIYTPEKFPNISYRNANLYDLNKKTGIDQLFHSLDLIPTNDTYNMMTTTKLNADNGRLPPNSRTKEKNRNISVDFCKNTLSDLSRLLPIN